MDKKKFKETLHVPRHSLLLICKFNSDEERQDALNSPEFKEMLGNLMVFVQNRKGEFVNKMSKL